MAQVFEVAVCRDARTSIHDGLKLLAQQVHKDPKAVVGIVDGVVEDVRQARARAKLLMERGEQEGNEKLLLVAQRYDEMVINAQVRLLELGVKAASEEQKSMDRQTQIQAFRDSRIPIKTVESQDATPDELKRLKQRQALLAAAQRQMPEMQDAEFSDRQTKDAEIVDD